jgi:hypothetical protein
MARPSLTVGSRSVAMNCALIAQALSQIKTTRRQPKIIASGGYYEEPERADEGDADARRILVETQTEMMADLRLLTALLTLNARPMLSRAIVH